MADDGVNVVVMFTFCNIDNLSQFITQKAVKVTHAVKHGLNCRWGEHGRHVRATLRRLACMMSFRAATSTLSFLDRMELPIIRAKRKVDLLRWPCESAENW